MSTEVLLNAQEVADYLRVNAAVVQAWAQNGRMPAIRFGRSWRFRRSALKTWLNHVRRDQRSIAQQG